MYVYNNNNSLLHVVKLIVKVGVRREGRSCDIHVSVSTIDNASVALFCETRFNVVVLVSCYSRVFHVIAVIIRIDGSFGLYVLEF